MAAELAGVLKGLRREKWELLREMSLLERQLHAAKQSGGGGLNPEQVSELKKAGAATRVDWANVPPPAKGAMLIELSQLHSTLRAERGAAEAALSELEAKHADLGAQVKTAGEELASLKQTEATRVAEAAARKEEMGAAIKELEEKISGVKAAAKKGASALSETRAQVWSPQRPHQDLTLPSSPRGLPPLYRTPRSSPRSRRCSPTPRATLARSRATWAARRPAARCAWRRCARCVPA